MGIPDSSLLDLIEKVRSWIWWKEGDLSSASTESLMPDNNYRMCCECGMRLTEFSLRYLCQSCGRALCGKCLHGAGGLVVASDDLVRTTMDKEPTKFCKFCFQASNGDEIGRECDGRIDPSVSPGQSPCFSSENFKDGNSMQLFQSDQLAHFFEVQQHDSSPHAGSSSSVASFLHHPSPVSFRRSSSRSDEEDGGDSGKHFFSPSSQYFQDNSDIDSSGVGGRHEFYSFKSVGSSPFDSPSRITGTPNRSHHSVRHDQRRSPRSHDGAPLDQETMDTLRRHETETETEDLENNDDGSDDLSVFQDHCEKVQTPLDFESNGLIWFPPPPNDEEDEAESNFFECDDDDDVGEAGMRLSSSSFNSDVFPVKEKPNQGHNEPLQAAVHGHFRALVSQLLQGEGICAGNGNDGEDWLDIITSVAWKAANFVKPDTSRGGSMDPVDYVRVKCIVSGNPTESTLIKGVVCTKNIKHKRMTSQYRNPRLLLLGGALEYQRAANQLASFDTLLQQEIDHLKMTVSKIEAYRPNVLLVEKSVSSYAQEYLLAKEISLVLNVKRPLLERIARCTGAVIVPSTDNLASARLGHCEIFRVEKVWEDCQVANQPNKKQAKNLMFFEGCPKRLGCTVLLKGRCRDELKKVKHVVQYAVFAAYHLSLETSFLADEGATLPRTPLNIPVAISETINDDNAILVAPKSASATFFQVVADECQHVGAHYLPGMSSSCHPESDGPTQPGGIICLSSNVGEFGSSSWHLNPAHLSVLTPGSMDFIVEKPYCDTYSNDLFPHVASESWYQQRCRNLRASQAIPSGVRTDSQNEFLESSVEEAITSRNHRQLWEFNGMKEADRIDGSEITGEYFCAADNHQSILVSLSSRCVLKGIVCERSRLLRIKFYGSFDKPLGRYLRDDLFDQTSFCRYCKEPTEAHVRCYTHQRGSLTINVRHLPSFKLPGERDGKIWMWHRCLKCAHIDGVPPATRRVVMSDAAWGLSFGKFLELSFSNHATANRIASCGHSLQRDCLRYYGFGSMVAFFRYSPIDILSVCLPPSKLEFGGQSQQELVIREAKELSNRTELLYTEIHDKLHSIEQKVSSFGHEPSTISDFQNHISELKGLLRKERNEYNGLLLLAGTEIPYPGQMMVDILEFNHFRRSLLIDSYIWDHRLCSLDSLLKTKGSVSKVDICAQEAAICGEFKEWRNESIHKDGKIDYSSEENNSESCELLEIPRDALQSEEKEESKLSLIQHPCNELDKMEPLATRSDEPKFLEDLGLSSGYQHQPEETCVDREVAMDKTSLETIISPTSNLSDKIDLAWTGSDPVLMKVQLLDAPKVDGNHAGLVENPYYRRLASPVRVHSFDSALRIQERLRKEMSSTALHLSPLRSFHASGHYRSMIRDPVPYLLRTYSQISARENQKASFIFSYTPSVITSAFSMADEGIRLLLPQTGLRDLFIAVYDNEPTSMIAYALSSKEYRDWIINKVGEHDGESGNGSNKDDLGNQPDSHHSLLATATHSVWHSFGSVELDDCHYRSYGSDDVSLVIGSLFSDPKKSPHLRISFGDESSTPAGKAKFSITCYFAKQFDDLRKKCCPDEVDSIRSLSRCRRWSAQGGKSNVYFAKSLDERFIIKQVTKTELDSFVEFAPEYFKYLTDSLNSGSPTCLAKIVGIYQVTVKHMKGGKEIKMDLMVMENLFFGRSMSRIYDLKGSLRSRYNPDTTGKNKVLLDMNLLETLCTEPIFLGSKAKRTLERAIWNDTSFLASIDVMDYSLLVGVDNEHKELVVGIIDYMRQYTWDKHLETWVKASGILGGPKNATPTVISPKQYKKRFRKAMSTYFLTVPDQWSS